MGSGCLPTPSTLWAFEPVPLEADNEITVRVISAENNTAEEFMAGYRELDSPVRRCSFGTISARRWCRLAP